MNPVSSEAVRATLLRAIQIESRNATIYESLAGIFQGYDDGVTGLFREMAGEERQHGSVLETRYRARYGAAAVLSREPKEVIEAPDLPDSEALIFDSMTVEQGLALGLRAEEEARAFYCREVERTTDAELKQIYRELSEFEDTHVRWLHERLDKARRQAQAASR